MHLRNLASRLSSRTALNALFAVILLAVLLGGYTLSRTWANSTRSVSALSANQAFSQASSTYGVPVELLKAICYMEGRLSNNNGVASPDNGFGCTHLVKNAQFDTLDKAASALGVSVSLLKTDMSTNILGGAYILREDALQLSSNQSLPSSLGDWYGALTVYSDSSVRSIATMYADAVYKIVQQGFTIKTDQGEVVTLAPEAVAPNTTDTTSAHALAMASLPGGCKATDSNVDYPGAIDCVITPPSTYDCNLTPTSACNYTGSARTNDSTSTCTVNYGSPSAPDNVVTQPCNIDQVVIHDTEGSLTSALSVFQNPNDGSSVQYIIDTDGTVYQVVREHDIAYHDGNFWSNMHSIGIEHVGYDATGYNWYNSAQYLASAKLVAYLLKKYNLPLDRSHVLAHGTVYASTDSVWNHVDPGPYWLWDYYFNLISQQGVALNLNTPAHTITLRPTTDQTISDETSSDYNFFKVYTQPSTASPTVQQLGSNDPIDVSYNVEVGISYYYLAQQPDASGKTGDTMYEIWYGVLDQSSSYFADAKLAWLAVPPGDGVVGNGTGISTRTAITVGGPNGSTSAIYSRPSSDNSYVIGEAPKGAIFTTGYSLTEDNSSNLWYEINFNHRQAWIPASELLFASPR